MYTILIYDDHMSVLKMFSIFSTSQGSTSFSPSNWCLYYDGRNSDFFFLRKGIRLDFEETEIVDGFHTFSVNQNSFISMKCDIAFEAVHAEFLHFQFFFSF